MSKRRDEMLDHEFDGIREYDNPPPPWIMWILYASVIFAVFYWMSYHTFSIGRLPDAKYDAEMARAAEHQLAQMAKQELSDKALLLMSAVPARVQDGRKIFEQYCVVCHMQNGEGSVGPNLTDAYWIHGGQPMQIFNTVTKGVPDKGMVAWGGQLGPNRVQAVVAYVLTIKGLNLPGKAPQGNPEVDAPPAPAGGPAIPGSATPAGATPAGAIPAGATPAGAILAGATPAGAIPSGATPPNSPVAAPAPKPGSHAN
jgi:cytochrome c oxidase cbb3-type subunit 3